MGKNSGEDVAKEAAEITEEVGADSEVAEGSGKLSLRDAIEVAIEANKSEKTEAKESIKAKAENRETQANDQKIDKPNRVNRETNKEHVDNQKISSSSYQPPAEWEKEDKELFFKSTPEQQAAALKLHNKRQGTAARLEEERRALNREKSEVQWGKDLVNQLEPYLKTNGRNKKPAHAEIIKALELVNEYDRDPVNTAIAILKAKGVAVPRELINQAKENSISPEIEALQKEVNDLKLDRVKEIQARTTNMALDAWKSFDSAVNAAGVKKYPDINDSESGLKMARGVGSLVFDNTPLAQNFIENCKNRIPGLTYTRLIEEAYKYLGGQVDDSSAPPTRTEDTRTHIHKSNRAAASVPGRGGTRTVSSGQTKKYKTTFEAAQAALAEYREREGH